MDNPSGRSSKASDIEKMVRAKALRWLKSQEAISLLGSIRCNTEAVAALEGYFKGWRQDPMSLENIVEYFILGYLRVGTSNGPALRSNLVSAIIRCHVGDIELNSTDRITKAREVRNNCPDAFWFMVTLARKHSSLCQEVLRSEFNSDILDLRRGVNDPNVHFAIESWSFGASVSDYGSVTLRARIPLSSVLSLRSQEDEIIVLRTPTELSCISVE